MVSVRVVHRLLSQSPVVCRGYSGRWTGGKRSGGLSFRVSTVHETFSNLLSFIKKLVRRFRYGPDLIILTAPGAQITGVDSLRRGYPRTYVRLSEGSIIRLDKDSVIKAGANVTVIRGGTFEMDARSYISSLAFIECGNRISIGTDCAIGREVLIRDRDGAVGNKPIKIGNGVHIGDRVIILKGTEIGDGCQIGAGSVVVGGKFPPNSLIAGNPARVKRTDHRWEPDKKPAVDKVDN